MFPSMSVTVSFAGFSLSYVAGSVSVCLRKVMYPAINITAATVIQVKLRTVILFMPLPTVNVMRSREDSNDSDDLCDVR
jgi:hypothetical protein